MEKEESASNKNGIIRKDYRTEKYAVFSLLRRERPVDYIKTAPISDLGPEKCPFEYGKEYLNVTVSTIGDPWRVRVIKNKYPFLTTDVPLESKNEGMLWSSSNYGHSYVIIDTPEHSHKFEDFNDAEVRELSESLFSTEELMYKDTKIKFVWINKDYGPLSSGTLSHSHWQEFGYPFVPFEIANRLDIAKRSTESGDGCLMERALEAEKPRFIKETQNVVAYAPYASLYTGESIVIPKSHVSRLGELDEKERVEILRMCAAMVRANNKIFGVHSYNILFYGFKDEKSFHAYAEIIPRFGPIGPMQFAGVYGSSIIPEDYAEKAAAALNTA